MPVAKKLAGFFYLQFRTNKKPDRTYAVSVTFGAGEVTNDHEAPVLVDRSPSTLGMQFRLNSVSSYGVEHPFPPTLDRANHPPCQDEGGSLNPLGIQCIRIPWNPPLKSSNCPDDV